MESARARSVRPLLPESSISNGFRCRIDVLILGVRRRRCCNWRSLFTSHGRAPGGYGDASYDGGGAGDVDVGDQTSAVLEVTLGDRLCITTR